MSIERLTIVGVGLIGGSLAAALRNSGFVQNIVGVESDNTSAQVALELGLVDEIASAVPDDAQLIAICTPSDLVAGHVLALREHTGVVMDVGSVKGAIVQSLEALPGGMPANFVPSHPISGSAESGPRAARDDLFVHALTVLTPIAATKPDAIDLVDQAWQAAGAQVSKMDACEHDRMLAVTSHLPHALAFAYMQQVSEADLAFTGGGFRDFTRIAAANPELWWRIFDMNKEALLAASRDFAGNLQTLIDALESDDAVSGEQYLARAAQTRKLLDDE